MRAGVEQVWVEEVWVEEVVAEGAEVEQVSVEAASWECSGNYFVADGALILENFGLRQLGLVANRLWRSCSEASGWRKRNSELFGFPGNGFETCHLPESKFETFDFLETGWWTLGCSRNRLRTFGCFGTRSAISDLLGTCFEDAGLSEMRLAIWVGLTETGFEISADLPGIHHQISVRFRQAPAAALSFGNHSGIPDWMRMWILDL